MIMCRTMATYRNGADVSLFDFVKGPLAEGRVVVGEVLDIISDSVFLVGYELTEETCTAWSTRYRVRHGVSRGDPKEFECVVRLPADDGSSISPQDSG